APGTGAPRGELFTIAGGAPAAADRSAAYAALLGALKRDPHGRTASLTSPGALVGLGMNDVVAVEWGGYFFPEHHVFATHYLISADTFRTLHLPVLTGRGITAADDWDAPRVAVVSHALAINNFAGGQVVGRKIQIIRGTFEWYTVVGVVADQPAVALGAKLQPRDAVYLSVLQHPAPNLELLVRGDNAARALPALPRGVVRTSQVSEASVIAG